MSPERSAASFASGMAHACPRALSPFRAVLSPRMLERSSQSSVQTIVRQASGSRGMSPERSVAPLSSRVTLPCARTLSAFAPAPSPHRPERVGLSESAAQTVARQASSSSSATITEVLVKTSELHTPHLAMDAKNTEVLNAELGRSAFMSSGTLGTTSARGMELFSAAQVSNHLLGASIGEPEETLFNPRALQSTSVEVKVEQQRQLVNQCSSLSTVPSGAAYCTRVVSSSPQRRRIEQGWPVSIPNEALSISQQGTAKLFRAAPCNIRGPLPSRFAPPAHSLDCSQEHMKTSRASPA